MLLFWSLVKLNVRRRLINSGGKTNKSCLDWFKYFKKEVKRVNLTIKLLNFYIFLDYCGYKIIKEKNISSITVKKNICCHPLVWQVNVFLSWRMLQIILQYTRKRGFNTLPLIRRKRKGWAAFFFIRLHPLISTL